MVMGLVAVGGLFAVNSLRAEPASKMPQPERVVNVNVEPQR